MIVVFAGYHYICLGQFSILVKNLSRHAGIVFSKNSRVSANMQKAFWSIGRRNLFFFFVFFLFYFFFFFFFFFFFPLQKRTGSGPIIL